MADSNPHPPGISESRPFDSNINNQDSNSTSQPPIEMNPLNPSTSEPTHLDGVDIPTSDFAITPPTGSPTQPSHPVVSLNEAAAAPADQTESTTKSHTPTALAGSEPKEGASEEQDTASASAIGPSTNLSPADMHAPSAEDGPILKMSLLLTNGNKHPFSITNKYLTKRKIKATNDDIMEISVYSLKELIWTDWRAGIYDTK
jgi:hypothetical protein